MIAWSQKLLRCFQYALSGIKYALRTQPNLQIHLVATLAVITLGFIVHLPLWKWAALTLCITLVWMAELFNTALEKLCDRVTLEKDESIRRVKDISAGAVLVTAIAALVMAVLIFLC